jgi:hypothetical protein
MPVAGIVNTEPHGGETGIGTAGCAIAQIGSKKSKTAIDNDFIMELPHIFAG